MRTKKTTRPARSAWSEPVSKPTAKRKAKRKAKTLDVQTQLDNIAKSLHALREAFERAYSAKEPAPETPQPAAEPGTFESLR